MAQNETKNDHLRIDMEEKILAIQESVGRYDAEYEKNKTVLQDIGDGLAKVLKHVSQ